MSDGTVRNLLSNIVVVLFALSASFVVGFQQNRLQVPGDYIVARVKAPPNVLNQFSQVQVIGFFKDGKSTSIRWLGDQFQVSIPTFGLEATTEEKLQKKTALKGGVPLVWGVQDSERKWISFEELDHITIQHGAETSEKEFAGFRNELRFVWADKGWRISHNGKKLKFDEIDIELRARRAPGA